MNNICLRRNKIYGTKFYFELIIFMQKIVITSILFVEDFAYCFYNVANETYSRREFPWKIW